MLRHLAPLALLVPMAVGAMPAAARAPSLEGVWRNAADSVRIRVARCGRQEGGGGGLCGTVTAASEKAKADAAAGGTDRLVGTQLFRDFRREDDGLWYGEVYVPDLARSVEGTIEQADANTLIGTGCLFAGFGCRSQTWSRIAVKR